MPTYNGERFLAAALGSVVGQHEGTELVIVDDGSTDRTLDIVREFAKVLPIRLITPGRIGNWVAISNIGLREAKGDWACFLHQDDLWRPGRLARLRREMENTKGALVVHDAMFVGPDGQELGPWTCPFSDGTILPDRFTERLLVQNFIAIPSPVFRRSIAIQFRKFGRVTLVFGRLGFLASAGSAGPCSLHRRKIERLPRPPSFANCGS